jgi:hypothetical protein
MPILLNQKTVKNNKSKGVEFDSFSYQGLPKNERIVQLNKIVGTQTLTLLEHNNLMGLKRMESYKQHRNPRKRLNEGLEIRSSAALSFGQ